MAQQRAPRQKDPCDLTPTPSLALLWRGNGEFHNTPGDLLFESKSERKEASGQGRSPGIALKISQTFYKPSTLSYTSAILASSRITSLVSRDTTTTSFWGGKDILICSKNAPKDSETSCHTDLSIVFEIPQWSRGASKLVQRLPVALPATKIRRKSAQPFALKGKLFGVRFSERLTLRMVTPQATNKTQDTVSERFLTIQKH